MGIYDRDYTQDRQFRIPFKKRSMVKTLLLVNIIVFIVNGVLASGARSSGLAAFDPHGGGWGVFSVEKGIFGLQIWRVVTYQFLHSGFFHLLGNMLGLFFLGPMVEERFGSRRFLAFYLIAGCGGAVLYTLLELLIPALLPGHFSTELVGASGCFFGIVAALMVFNPSQTLRLLFLPFEFTVRQLGWFILILAGLRVLVGDGNAGGEAAHLGGALFGWMFSRNPQWLDFADRGISVIKPARKKKFRVVDGGRKGAPKKRGAAPTRDEVDAVLDKIAKSGIGSLSAKEKTILEQARKDL